MNHYGARNHTAMFISYLSGCQEGEVMHGFRLSPSGMDANCTL